MMAQRNDVYTFDAKAWREAPAGGIFVRGRLTRTGTMYYADAQGAPYKELRRREEVFSDESLASLRGAPVTIGHPEGEVTPENWIALTRGSVVPPFERELDPGDPNLEWISADIVVSDKSTIESVKRGDLVELSCGYTCELVDSSEPGVRYEQKAIKYNHLALLPAGQARAGANARIRSDSLTAIEPHNNIEGKMTLEDALKKIASLEVEAAKLASERDSLRADADSAKGRLVAIEAEVAQLRADSAADKVQEKALALLTLADQVRTIDPKADVTGKGERALLELGAGRKDGSDEFLRGILAGKLESAKRADASAARAAKVIDSMGEESGDEDEDDKSDEGEDEDEEKSKSDSPAEEFAKQMKDAYKKSGYRRSK